MEHVYRGATLAPACAPWPLTRADNSPTSFEDMYMPQGNIRWVPQGILPDSLFTAPTGLELTDTVACANGNSGMTGPPKLPSDPHFQLEATSVYMAYANPREIWHQLLGFMDHHATVSITKVSHDKYSLKAEVRGAQSIACCVKIRMYCGHHPGSLAIEFQRRDGDCLPFNSMFRHACAGLHAYAIPARIPTDELMLAFCSCTHREPPKKPADPLFQLMATTIYLTREDPRTIWVRLLEFIGTHKMSTRKVRPDKYSFKAEMHGGMSGMCCVKVHVYLEEQQDSVAVEFQRRDGDSILFHSIYRHAHDHLRACAVCDGM